MKLIGKIREKASGESMNPRSCEYSPGGCCLFYRHFIHSVLRIRPGLPGSTGGFANDQVGLQNDLPERFIGIGNLLYKNLRRLLTDLLAVGVDAGERHRKKAGHLDVIVPAMIAISSGIRSPAQKTARITVMAL